MVNRKID